MAPARLRRELDALTGPLAVHDRYRRVRARLYARLASFELAYVGPGATIDPSVHLTGTRRIFVGDGTNITEHARLNTYTNGEIRLGQRVWVGPNVVLNASGRLEIGDDVLLAGNCFLSTLRHRFEGDGPIRWQGGAGRGDVAVGAGAWLASNVVVMPGVTIGAGAVIGANSVVTRDVPDRHIAAGAPAEIIRAI
jgi:acetyltransferase-like isoleucine patch superfamily enzyme